MDEFSVSDISRSYEAGAKDCVASLINYAENGEEATAYIKEFTKGYFGKEKAEEIFEMAKDKKYEQEVTG